MLDLPNPYDLYLTRKALQEQDTKTVYTECVRRLEENAVKEILRANEKGRRVVTICAYPEPKDRTARQNGAKDAARDLFSGTGYTCDVLESPNFIQFDIRWSEY